ncbi:uncharacterized protein F4812DRAFT_211032 [Daldinia caldariorum]|uniref:uncharacterized protein n=1 Tax=Daldinia caldariorum TaxID=326644 RepID=UPI002007C5CC|nr:uncharacterized protein F4812DRAFT_211032 [Daldinia caldariorum]KAI1464411.1 hypothetical protein F4812DRAFT_211032 [Daldinia caldariorum]
MDRSPSPMTIYLFVGFVTISYFPMDREEKEGIRNICGFLHPYSIAITCPNVRYITILYPIGSLLAGGQLYQVQMAQVISRRARFAGRRIRDPLERTYDWSGLPKQGIWLNNSRNSTEQSPILGWVFTLFCRLLLASIGTCLAGNYVLKVSWLYIV